MYGFAAFDKLKAAEIIQCFSFYSGEQFKKALKALSNFNFLSVMVINAALLTNLLSSAATELIVMV